MLHGKLLPLMTEIKDKKTISQRDNASIHTAANKKKWSQDIGVGLLSWPALSPDSNSIENL